MRLFLLKILILMIFRDKRILLKVLKNLKFSLLIFKTKSKTRIVTFQLVTIIILVDQLSLKILILAILLSNKNKMIIPKQTNIILQIN